MITYLVAGNCKTCKVQITKYNKKPLRQITVRALHSEIPLQESVSTIGAAGSKCVKIDVIHQNAGVGEELEE